MPIKSFLKLDFKIQIARAPNMQLILMYKLMIVVILLYRHPLKRAKTNRILRTNITYKTVKKCEHHHYNTPAPFK